MTKIIVYAVKVFLLLMISSSCSSQTETFDIATYTAPKDFKKDTKPDVITYSHVNTTSGIFCVIAIYASSASTGDAQKDFDKDWKDLVATPFSADANPKTETQSTPEGWQLVTGAAPIKMDGIDCTIMLNVISGFGKTISFRTSLNDQSYSTQINALFESMELDKTTTPSPNIDNIELVTTSGGSGQFGLMKYTTPAGWREQIFSDGVVFKPLDLPDGDLLSIQLMQPLNYSGSLEQALEQSFAEATTMYNGTSMYQSGGKYSKNAPQKSFNGWEYIRGKGGINVDGGTERGLEVFVVKVNNRFERVAVLESRRYCGGSQRYYASDRTRYRTGIEDLLYSLQFSDLNTQALKSGSAKGSGITGLWQGTIQGTAAGFGLQVFSPIFFNNGQVYFGPKVPTEGLDGLNSRIPPELYPRDWGTYTFSNGSGMLQMPYGSIPFRTQGDKLVVTKNQTDWPFYKLNSVDGARFNGTYTMPKSYEMFPVITFTADGQFNDKGVIRVLGHTNNECVNEGTAPGSGTYEVKNYSVIFNYSDGRKVRLAFLGAGYDKSNPSPPTLRMSFNEDPMTRQ